MTIKDIAEILKQNNNFEILTHNYPDGDCLGSGFGLCMALRQIGKNANVITTDSPKSFDYITKKVENQNFEPEYIVSVDVADEKRGYQGARRKDNCRYCQLPLHRDFNRHGLFPLHEHNLTNTQNIGRFA